MIEGYRGVRSKLEETRWMRLGGAHVRWNTGLRLVIEEFMIKGEDRRTERVCPAPTLSIISQSSSQMAPISLDNMQFYAPPLQVSKPSPSAQKIPPASSVAAPSATVAVPTGDQEGQSAETRPRDEKAPPTDIEMGSLWTDMTDASPDEPTANTEGVEHVQGGEGRRGIVVPSELYFTVLLVQDLGSRSTASSRRPPATTTPTTTTVSLRSRSCYFLMERAQLDPLAPRVRRFTALFSYPS